MSVTTRTGDDGKSRFLGKIVSKDDNLLEAIGTLDELQSLVEDEEIQKDLYEIMGVLAGGEKDVRCQISVVRLEKEIEKVEVKLPPKKEFIIFKSAEGRKLNIARTVCRRAERRLVTLSRTQQIDLNIFKYINRLSDYLFIKAREAETPLSFDKLRTSPLEKGRKT